MFTICFCQFCGNVTLELGMISVISVSVSRQRKRYDVYVGERRISLKRAKFECNDRYRNA